MEQFTALRSAEGLRSAAKANDALNEARTLPHGSHRGDLPINNSLGRSKLHIAAIPGTTGWTIAGV